MPSCTRHPQAGQFVNHSPLSPGSKFALSLIAADFRRWAYSALRKAVVSCTSRQASQIELSGWFCWWDAVLRSGLCRARSPDVVGFCCLRVMGFHLAPSGLLMALRNILALNSLMARRDRKFFDGVDFRREKF